MGKHICESTSLDLDSVVRQWAWRLFDKTATKSQRKLHEKERRHANQFVHMSIDWSKLKAIHKTTWMESSLDTQTGVTMGPPSILPDVPDSPVSKVPGKTLIFDTQYTNATNFSQTYHLKTSRTTRSYCMVEVKRGGITKQHGTPVQLLSPPKPARTGDGYSALLSIPNSEGGVMEYEQDWAVSEPITVPAHQMIQAQVLTDEKILNGEFTVVTELSGQINVVFTDVQNNNSFMKAMSGDVEAIIEDFLVHERGHGRSWKSVDPRRTDSSVLVTTEGTCSFRYNTNPHVTANRTSPVSC